MYCLLYNMCTYHKCTLLRISQVRLHDASAAAESSAAAVVAAETARAKSTAQFEAQLCDLREELAKMRSLEDQVSGPSLSRVCIKSWPLPSLFYFFMICFYFFMIVVTLVAYHLNYKPNTSLFSFT